MHFEVLVEDESGKRALEILVPKIVGDLHTFRIIGYKGIWRIPRGLDRKTDPRKRILLDQLPRLLKGYGKAWATYPPDQFALFIVCDLDARCRCIFGEELLKVLDDCAPKPLTQFCFAIEEGEAWLLGGYCGYKESIHASKGYST
jgi:hypothetical protein